MRNINEEIHIPRGDAVIINMDSPIFAEAMTDMNAAMLQLLEEIGSGHFSGGEVNLKIKVSVATVSEEIKVQDENDAEEKLEYHFRNPTFEHVVSTSLKKSGKIKGAYSDDRKELRCIDGEYFILPIPTDQLTMEEYLEAQKN